VVVALTLLVVVAFVVEVTPALVVLVFSVEVVVATLLLDVELDPDPAELAPGTIAELVTVATLLLCATELGNPLYSVGPGIVYASGLVYRL